jgi:hypothetical protein
MASARYGLDPHITFFETACVTDNAIGAVLLPDVPDVPDAAEVQ